MEHDVNSEGHIIAGPPMGEPSGYKKGFFEELKRNGDKIKKCNTCNCNIGVSRNQIKQRDSLKEKGIKYKYMCTDCIYKDISFGEIRALDVANSGREEEIVNLLETYLKHAPVLFK